MMIRWWWLGAISFGMAQVSFNVAPNLVAINEYVQFQVVIEGQSRDIPHFPKGFAGEDFSLVRNSPDQQSSMTMVNGKVSRKMIYTYHLQAKREGVLVLQPQTLSLAGQLHKSPAYRIEVTGENKSVNSGRRRSDPFQDLFGRRDRRPKNQEKAEIFTEAEVPKSSYFLGEPIPFTVSIYRTPGVEISNSGSAMELPNFDDFWSEEIATRQDPKRVRRGDKILEKITVDQRQLFASKAGKLTIQPATFKLTVAVGRGFFADWQTVNRKTEPVEITVKPLPDVGKPADFGGAVGRFAVRGELDKSSIAVGESVSLKVDVSGSGNFNALSEIKLLEMGGPFEIFDGGAPTVEKANGIVRSKSWVFALVAKREGQFEIPLPQITYFDLTAGTYRTTPPKTFTLEVKGGEGLIASGPVGGDRAPMLASQNLNYIMQGPLSSKVSDRGLTSPRPLYWLAGAMLLLNLAIFASRLASRQLQGNQAQSRPRLALRHCLKKMDQLKAEQDHEVFHAGLAQAVFTYFGDKWRRPAQGISLEDIQGYFNRKDLDESLTHGVVDVVETCERARFTPASTASRDQLLSQARGVVQQIDEVMA